MNIPKDEILYIAHRIPYPPNKGDKIRSFHEIKHLSARFTIDLVCLADAPGDIQWKGALKAYCRRVDIFPLKPMMGKLKGIFSLMTGRSISEGYFYHLGMAKTIKQRLSHTHYRAILCFSSPMARYLELETNLKDCLRIMDFCDLDSDKWLQYANRTRFPLNCLYRMEGGRLFAFEKKINQTFDASVFVSDKEASLFKTVFPRARNVSAIPNGVDRQYFSPNSHKPFSDKEGPTLMFAGVMDYYANVDGVLWFCKKIYPLIVHAFPTIRLIIAGSNPAPEIQRLHRKQNIVVTGFVPDMRPWYARADICVVPLRIARGVQNKVLEAMAMAKPVVSTPTALQGVSAVPGRHLVAADTPKKFAKGVLDLLTHPLDAEKMGQQAAAYVASTHNWDLFMDKFSTLISGSNRHSSHSQRS